MLDGAAVGSMSFQKWIRRRGDEMQQSQDHPKRNRQPLSDLAVW